MPCKIINHTASNTAITDEHQLPSSLKSDVNCLEPSVRTKAKAPMTPICAYFSLEFESIF